jgi:hypothetical protein
MSLQQEIQSAIGAHGLWKGRLKDAIQRKPSDLSVAVVRDDHACAFGKWLQSADAVTKKSKSYQKCGDLHRRFHLATADVLGLALAGKSAEASQAIAPGSQFFKASIELTQAMMAWATEAK